MTTQAHPLLANENTADEQLVVAQPDSATLMFERLAKDPNVDVEKLERLIAMQERIMRFNAEAAFNVAFARMQPDIPTIKESKDWDDKGTYAPLEDIVEVIRPIISRHGFTISHKTEWPDKDTVRVIGILTHQGGHARTSEFQAAADKTGSKNAIQALGSAASYGKRYTTKDLLCIVTRGEDDNGQKTEGPVSPEGYDEWLAKLQDTAVGGGMPAFAKLWNDSKEDFRKFLARTAPKMLANIRETAAKVKAAK